ncbi:MAG: sigma-70 family RNA polymerase sigma factor [Oscillospiraceae bacterium]|nr:sigma-70 family RNA polymerase sigma factor [Oscillospiraceae bacterium]
MLSTMLYLLSNSVFFTLRMSGGGVGSFPRPLSAEEERECLTRCAEGDMEARRKLIEHNLRLVAHIVKKYYTQTDEQEDLISIGTIGLIKAINSFDASKGARLPTYAARCIENPILSPTRFRKGSVALWAENAPIGAFWTEFPRICISFPVRRIHM